MFNKEGLIDKIEFNDGSNQWLYKFDNMYGASVIDYGYGREEHLYEVGVLYWDGFTRNLAFSEINPDGEVIGWCTIDRVNEILNEIKQLKGWD